MSRGANKSLVVVFTIRAFLLQTLVGNQTSAPVYLRCVGLYMETDIVL